MPVGGFDTLFATTSYTLAPATYVEVLSVAELVATTAINLTGNDFANTLYGNAGANVLDGRGGADTLIGFGGNDVYLVDNAGDPVVESPGGGFDTIYALSSYRIYDGNSIEVLSTANPAGPSDQPHRQRVRQHALRQCRRQRAGRRRRRRHC